MGPFIIPELRPEPVVVRQADIEAGRDRRLLLVVAHADDPAIFAGGAIAMWSAAGWSIHCLRVTDDRWDSVGLDEAETIARNAAEFREASALLGISEVEDLGWQTDVLGDASRVALRERIIHAIRRLKPYGVITFDPDSMFHEDNLDHRVLAQAVDEACWTAQFDKHHSEHLAEGFGLHGVYERWYFGRSVASVTHVFDTTHVASTKKQAILCHRTMLENIATQMELQARTAGVSSAVVRRAIEGDLSGLADFLATAGDGAKGKPFGVEAAEYFRLSRARFPE